MSDTRTYYYARVSSRDQNLARQLEAFRVLGADERSIITDQESGKDLNRPGYMALKNAILRPGDTLVITSLDRLSRRKADIETELLWFREQHIRLKILDLPTTMTDFPAGQEWVADMVNNIIIEVLGTMAEQERLRTRQRQAEGYAAARAAGRKMGRPRLARPPQWPEIYAAWQAGSLPPRRLLSVWESEDLPSTSWPAKNNGRSAAGAPYTKKPNGTRVSALCPSGFCRKFEIVRIENAKNSCIIDKNRIL
ncbi:MAG: recombinase family protein [Vescimonas sp.]